jgi:hypothetical protein
MASIWTIYPNNASNAKIRLEFQIVENAQVLNVRDALLNTTSKRLNTTKHVPNAPAPSNSATNAATVNVLSVKKILPLLIPPAAVGNALLHGKRLRTDGHTACAHTLLISKTTTLVKRAIK